MIEVNLYAGAAEALGSERLSIDLQRLATPTLGALVQELLQTEGAAPNARQVLGVCSLLVDGQSYGPQSWANMENEATEDNDVTLADGIRVDVLPPFAGG